MIKLKLELYPKDGQILSNEYPNGYKFRAIVMAWLNEVSADLVEELHALENIRRYAINCRIHKNSAKIDFVLVSYQDGLIEALVQDFFNKEKLYLKIGQKNYYMENIYIERINPHSFIEDAKPVKTFNINYVQPVYFNTNMGDYPVRFPIPNLLFGNLVNIWNDFCDDSIEIVRKDFINWINTHLFVSGYRMRSVNVEIGKIKPVVGGLGNVSYQVTKINKDFYKHYSEQLNRQIDDEFINQNYQENCRNLEILCKLGEYTNVGANRTAGLGVIRYYPKKYLSENDFLLQN